MKIMAITGVVIGSLLIAAAAGIPSAPSPTHPFVDNNDGDATCDLPMKWREGWTLHTECDQSHQDPWNMPTHSTDGQGNLIYVGEGQRANNNYH